MSASIAIVGMACCYADARNPQELWENVLARRRAFRRLPAERLQLHDYFSPDPETPDAIYAAQAALISDYEFDRMRFRVAGPTFRSVDMTHWLALDIASQALQDAGFLDDAGFLHEGRSLPQESTGVLVGNTLTGEFSRAATLRLRWPYVRRVVESRLQTEGWDETRRAEFLSRLEDDYKAPFPSVGEETLAGALSNTIAGRICNHFHLGGGGYTLDGACCSSLLAVARSCSALAAGEIDVALAGGVDLSLDPFELVGFAKAGALARGEMLVYDRSSSGFLPGEGSGFVVLMREDDAQAQGLPAYAIIRGWGISSDGGGGITRPEIHGQMLALERAYQRAGYGANTVVLFEGHGTGTPVGDEVELQALVAARGTLPSRTAATQAAAIGSVFGSVIGSVKANIGHTKAAAGVAGLIKAALAIHHQVLPPITGLREPRPELDGDAGLRALPLAEPWPETLPLRAGVNSFGFGGINVHVTLEGRPTVKRKQALSARERMLAFSAQDAELFLFTAESPSLLAGKIDLVREKTPGLAYAELADLAASLAAELGSGSSRSWRAAVVAASPSELEERLGRLRAMIEQGVSRHIGSEDGIFLGLASSAPRIGFLFPGQASPVRLEGGAHARRFPAVKELYDSAQLGSEDVSSTATAQIAIATAEAAGLRLVAEAGIPASVAVGHSVGELAAWCWAGAVDEGSFLSLVRTRGRCMAEIPGPPGAMASISATAAEVESLLKAETGQANPVVVACFNADNQIVVAGESGSVQRLVARAQSRGWNATLLPTANAFHSPLMAPAARPFQQAVSKLETHPLRRRVVSTITGAKLLDAADLRALMVQQLTAPVRFSEALADATCNVDFFIEIGPGRILTHLANGASKTPAIALDMAGPSLAGLLQAAAAAHVVGVPLRTEALFKDRFTRPFDFKHRSHFFANPCESAALSSETLKTAGTPAVDKVHSNGHAAGKPVSVNGSKARALEVVRTLVAQRTELPAAAISESAHLLRDLHLNSIVVGELVASAARQLGMSPPRQLLNFADATVGETAKALEQLRAAGANSASSPNVETVIAGVDDWQRAFTVDWAPLPLLRRARSEQSCGSWKLFDGQPPEIAAAVLQKILPGTGSIICWSQSYFEDQAGLGLLLDAAQELLADQGHRRYFVVVGAAGTASVASAFARTLHLEDPDILTRIIEAPLDARGVDSNIVDRIIAEIGAAGACVEARYDSSGQRFQARMRLLDLGWGADTAADKAAAKAAEEGFPLGCEDVVLVSGGGKGIVAECSLALARDTGAALVILGRSRPEHDAGLAAHLQKLTDQGIRARYIAADVTDMRAITSAVAEAEAALGRVTAIVHGAGRNHPKLLRDLDRTSLLETCAPKVQGLRNLLAAVDADRLRLLVTFGSVIGRIGLRGEADYALANACQSLLTEQFAREHPDCRCLAFESSAWSGIGMAERLGSVEALRRDGVAAIPLEQGVAWFLNLLSRKVSATSIMVAGRLGTRPPLPMQGEIPLLRFLEKPRLHYPGVELVADAELSTASDPYLLDHVFENQPLFPGVMALEAMTQAAMALTGQTSGETPGQTKLPVLSGVTFDRPVVVAPGTQVTLRVAALVRAPGQVEVVVRSSSTSFQVDHFRCVCSFTQSSSPIAPNVLPGPNPPSSSLLPAVDPDEDLYGKLLFQTGRFHRLSGYRFLNAHSCWAEIALAKESKKPGPPAAWFSQYLPPALLLGDAGARDAALHAVQACVPHAVLLPIGVKRLYAGALNTSSPEELLVHAQRRWVQGPTYCYDVELSAADGTVRERWEELQLRRVADAPNRDWPDSLVAAFLEWRVEETIPASAVVAAFDRDGAVFDGDGAADLNARRSRSERAIHKALNSFHPLTRGANGKPEIQPPGPTGVSAAHSGSLTLAVAGPKPVACDLEPVRERSQQMWRDLLGRDRCSLAELIAGEAGEDFQTAATRVWTALESLKKAAAPLSEDTPLVLVSCSREKQGCVSLAASGLRISTSIVQFRDDPTQFAVSVLAGSNQQS
jgi:enediyne polyketide synthase